MSDYYLALVDPVANVTNAKERANRLRDGLIVNGIISAETSEECVYGGLGHLPGPHLKDLYVLVEGLSDRPPELRDWDTLGICGVEIHAEKWVNVFGFTVFESAKCPACEKTFGNRSEIMTPLSAAVSHFLKRDEPTTLQCPSCQKTQTVQSWITTPHLGFCHVAAQFWNWPRFDAPGWQISIPEIASRILETNVVTTFGRM